MSEGRGKSDVLIMCSERVLLKGRACCCGLLMLFEERWYVMSKDESGKNCCGQSKKRRVVIKRMGNPPRGRLVRGRPRNSQNTRTI